MRCPHCGHDNPYPVTFCSKCHFSLQAYRWTAWTYTRVTPRAQFIKLWLQILVGIGLISLLGLQLATKLQLPGANGVYSRPPLAAVLCFKPLSLVGFALAYAAGIELAYMLFTPGPDEAVEPLITGLAAAVLLSVSEPRDHQLAQAGIVAIYVLLLIVLFLIRERFINNRS